MIQKPTYNEWKKTNAIDKEVDGFKKEYEELGPEQPMQEGKKPNKAVLLLLTLCFGGIGAHQFYMKKFKKGIIDYLFDCWTLLPNARSFVEFFAYLNTKTEDLQ